MIHLFLNQEKSKKSNKDLALPISQSNVLNVQHIDTNSEKRISIEKTTLDSKSKIKETQNSSFYQLPPLITNKFKQTLTSFLNKGIMPQWEQIILEFSFLEGDHKIILENQFNNFINWTFLDSIFTLNYQEIFFHGPQFIEVLHFDGKKEELPIDAPFNENDWQLWLEIVALQFKQNWNVRNPFCSFHGELKNKSFRFTLLHESTSPQQKSKLFLRSLSTSPFELKSFGSDDLLLNLVRNRHNVLIAGATGSGKTSLLSSMINNVHCKEHVVILEDTYEIMCEHPSHTSLISGEEAGTDLKSYMAYAMRLSPDRLIIGEMRSKEVIPFVLAMNTGHKGLMSTIHATSAIDAIYRVVLLFSLSSENGQINYDQIMNLVTRNIEYVVFVENKKVKEIIKILGSEKSTPFYEICSIAP